MEITTLNRITNLHEIENRRIDVTAQLEQVDHNVTQVRA